MHCFFVTTYHKADSKNITFWRENVEVAYFVPYTIIPNCKLEPYEDSDPIL